MCRYQSGFFFEHALLDSYEYYWRVEPNVKFLCDIPYDPFKVMKDHNRTYGFVVSLYEYQDTIPSLWKTTKGERVVAGTFVCRGGHASDMGGRESMPNTQNSSTRTLSTSRNPT